MDILRSVGGRVYFALLRDPEEGQAMVEYALILFLVSIASITVLTALGGEVRHLFLDVDADF
jgi:Flp pilus assembly pilin Flp